jgi:hypothetical protein
MVAGSFTYIYTPDIGQCAVGDSMEVLVNPVPGVTATPEGPATVDNFLTPSSMYTSSGADFADTYMWMLEPSEAGSINGNGTTADVTWAEGYAGTAAITVYGMNDCGDGEVSENFEVQLYTSQGVDENAIGQIRVYPNPNNGSFNLEISTLAAKSLNIRLTNSLGETIYRKNDIPVNGKLNEVINTGMETSGMVILQVSDGKNTWQGKVFIEK